MAFSSLAPALRAASSPAAVANIATRTCVASAAGVREQSRSFFAGAVAGPSRVLRPAPARSFSGVIRCEGLPGVPYAPGSADMEELPKYVGARPEKGEIDMELYAFRTALALATDAVVKAEHADKAAKMFEDYADWVRRVEIPAGRLESFDMDRDASNPAHFVLFERYRDEDAVEEHQATSEVQEFMSKLEPLLEQPMSLSLYSELQREEDRAPILSHTMFPYGPVGEGGADDQPMR